MKLFKSDVPHDEKRTKREGRKILPEDRKLLTLSVGTLAAHALIGLIIVVIMTVISGAVITGGYLNSIPRILERRDVYLESTDVFYSRDFTVRGEIAALLYDNTDAADLYERASKVKETIGAAGVAVLDQDGTVIVDTDVPVQETVATDEPLSSKPPTQTLGPSSDESASKDAETSSVLGAGEIEQIISSDNDLIIINEDTSSEGTLTFNVSPEQDGSDEPTADEDGSEGTSDEDTEKESEGTDETEADVTDDSEGEQVAIEWNAASEEDEPDTGEETAEDSTTYVYYRAKIQGDQTLVVKYDPTASLSVNQEEGQWEKLLNRLVSGFDAYAFVREDETNTWTGISLESITEEEYVALQRGLAEVDRRVSFSIPFAEKKGLSDIRFGVMSLTGKLFLVELHTVSEKGLTFLIAVPFSRFFPGPLRSYLSVVVFFVLSILFLVRYIWLCIAGLPEEDDFDKMCARVRVACRSGLIVVISVLAVFAFLVIMLDKSATTSTIVRSQRQSLTDELRHQEESVKAVLEEYNDASVTQAKALANLLSGQPQLRTRAGLKRLSEIVGARYLMLFDKSGTELFSSNSYVGFKIEKDEDLSVETIVDAPGLQAVLLGETCVISDPIEDSQGNVYHVIGTLVTDAEDLPNGFLVMAVDDPKADTEYQDDLSPLMNREGQIALIVDDESGKILKHSDVSKVGDPAKVYLSEDLLGRSYEGYAWYEKEYVYMSADSVDGVSTIVLSKNTMGVEEVIGLALLVILNSIIICLIFYPYAIKYCCYTSRRELKVTSVGNPLSVFLYGYSIYFCGLSIAAYISSSRGNWPAFNAVFEGAWTNGMNLFSVWSALFFTTQAMAGLYVIKRVLKHLAEYTLASSSTLIRLCDSLISYVITIAVALVDLTWFGVDTTTLIASAGIVSIAIGMGAKDLIADILAGMFIIFESSVHIGDIVEIGTWRGTVTDIGIRTCEITDRNNNVKVVNNSHISELVNFSRKSTSCTLEFDIDRDVAVSDVPQIVQEYIDVINSEVPEVANTLHYVGITSITDSTYKISIGWSCDESKREALTFRINITMRLILERERRHKAAGESADKERTKERKLEKRIDQKLDQTTEQK